MKPSLRLCIATGLTLLCGTSVFAQTPAEAVANRLRDQGYSDIEIERTFLRRLRVEAEKDGQVREIVIHPRTGAVLRDFTYPDDDEGDADDDDRDEDDRDDENRDDLDDDADEQDDAAEEDGEGEDQDPDDEEDEEDEDEDDEDDEEEDD